MDCKICKTTITIKSTDEWVSLKCNCQIMIIYNDFTTVTKSKKEYNPTYKGINRGA